MDLRSRKKPLERLLDALVTHAFPLSLVLIVVGYCGFVALPLMERKISFDENALLAGSAHTTIRCRELLAVSEHASACSSTCACSYDEPTQQGQCYKLYCLCNCANAWVTRTRRRNCSSMAVACIFARPTPKATSPLLLP